MIGETLGGYRITRKIGEGGMGTVYEAEHAMIGRRAAIKCLLPELVKNEEACQRFMVEARAAAKLNHPGLVEIFEFGKTGDGGLYIVMEYLDGEDLGHKLQRESRLSLRMAVSIGRDVAAGLGAVHEKGIIHRDLKPDNLYLVNLPGSPGQFRVKVLDFGIAKLTGPENKELSVKTRTGSVLGTPSYMSPEQCRGHGKVDWRSDIYSLGCIVHEMITGHPPFRGSGFGEVLAQHIYEPPPALRSFDPSIPEMIDQAILRCLVKDPTQRLQSMDELGAALDAYLASLSLNIGQPIAIPPPRAGAITIPATTPLSAPATTHQEPRSTTTMRGTASQMVEGSAKKGKALIFALGCVVAIAAVAGVVVMSGGDGASKPAAVVATTAAEPPPAPEPPKPIAAAVPAPEPPKPVAVAVVTPAPEPPKPIAAAVPAPEPPKPVAVSVPVPSGPPPAPKPVAPVVPPVPAKVKVTLNSEPSGAEVLRDGRVVGKTPFEKELDPGPGKLAYVVKLAGYQEGHADLPGDKGGQATVKLVAQPKVVAAPPPAPPRPAPVAAAPAPRPATAIPKPAATSGGLGQGQGHGKKTKPVKDGVVNPFK